MRSSSHGLAFVLAMALAGAGCAAAAVGAAAGAAGAVYLTDNGAETVLDVGHPEALAAAERAFADFGVAIEERKVETDEGAGVTTAELRGETEDGEKRVTAEIRDQGENKTRVTVTARDDLVSWDEDLSRRLVERIVELAG